MYLYTSYIYIYINSASFSQIPTSIEKRISTLSSNETIFNESKEIYQEALEKYGYR